MRSFYVFTQRVSLRVHTSKYGGIKLFLTYVQCNSFHRGIKRNAGKSDLCSLAYLRLGPGLTKGVESQNNKQQQRNKQTSSVGEMGKGWGGFVI